MDTKSPANFRVWKVIILISFLFLVLGGLYYLSLKYKVFNTPKLSGVKSENANKDIDNNILANYNSNISPEVLAREKSDEQYLATLPIKPITKGTVRVPVLLYHHVEEYSSNMSEGERSYYVSPNTFARQMSYLAENNYSVIPLSRLVDYLKTGNNKPPARSVVITFDDGTIGQYEYAYKILRYYDFPATFFIVPMWTEEAEQKQKGGYVNWKQLEEMADNGMEIGSHAMTHKTLTEATPEGLDYEILESKNVIEEKLNREINFFAYPGGSNNAEAIKDVAAAGYLAALSVDKRIDHKVTQIYTLGRMHIDDDLPYFKARIDGRWQR